MAQQVQAKQRELQSKLEAMLASVEDERLRPMRKQGFLAMAKCCDLSDPTAYQQCLQKAQLPEQRASQVVQGELNDFQGRLQRAIATCQDDVKDGGYSDQNRAQNVFNTCVGKVFDAHAGMLGDVKKRIEKGLSR
jgi:hypothetical protein